VYLIPHVDDAEEQVPAKRSSNIHAAAAIISAQSTINNSAEAVAACWKVSAFCQYVQIRAEDSEAMLKLFWWM
jgi:hypothetical protein